MHTSPIIEDHADQRVALRPELLDHQRAVACLDWPRQEVKTVARYVGADPTQFSTRIVVDHIDRAGSRRSGVVCEAAG
jgi:hypothetical protein